MSLVATVALIALLPTFAVYAPHVYWWVRVQRKIGWRKGWVKFGDVRGLKIVDRLLPGKR